MAITTRYFSTSSEGAGDGTTWEDRAELLPSGNWSSVITGFDFTSDSMVARIGPGSYSCSQLLQNGTFTVVGPTITTPLVLHACDSSGNLLAPPDPDWTSDLPVWDLTNIPVIATTSNITTISATNVWGRLLKLTASARSGPVVSNTTGGYDWCVVVNSQSNASAAGINGPNRVSNCVVQMTGTAFASALSYNAGIVGNVRLEGNPSASSGAMRGLSHAGTSQSIALVTATGFPGGGISSSSTNTAHTITVTRCTLVNNPGGGFLGHSTASQTATYVIDRCIITGNGTYGVDASASNIFVKDCRLRDNTSGNINGAGNYPTDLGNYTTDSDDASEYVDAGAGNFQIKATATIAGMGFGVSQECPAGSGGTTVF